jgi:signal transduction histidine kinase
MDISIREKADGTMIDTWRRFTEEHPRVIDTLIFVLLMANAVVAGYLVGAGPAAPTSLWRELPVIAVGTGSLFWRRRYPRAVTGVTGVAVVVVAGFGYLPSLLLIDPAMVALFSLAVRTDRRTANSYAMVITVPLICVTLGNGSTQQSIILKTVSPAALLLLPVALGTITRMGREYVALLKSRAENAERTREQEARSRVAEERMRIARDLHDVVAHHLALANAQAGTAAHIARTDPNRARELLNELTSTTSAALRELKATVGLLRQPDDTEAPTSPTPGLAQLPELAESFASTGLLVEIEAVGTPRPLDPGVDLTAYRIVQEALTNVTKHAATEKAHVQLAYTDDRITVSVTDEATARRPRTPAATAPAISATSASASASSGFGLIGMRERAVSVGGLLRAGRRPEGGFQVAAELPLRVLNPRPFAGPASPERSETPETPDSAEDSP